MQTAIYYFTGTGNSLFAARRVGEALGGAELYGIPALRDRERIVPTAPRVGVVCPVHALSVPGLVADFICRLDLGSAEYVFLIVTYAVTPGAAIPAARRLFRHAGKGLDFGAGVRMPSNDIGLADIQPPAKRERVLAAAEERLARLARDIASGARQTARAGPVGWFLTLIGEGLFVRHRHSLDRGFWVTDSCDGCGGCERVCPAGNIALEEGRPVWRHRCEMCLACIHYCPTQAIQLGKRTLHRGRYHHPQVSAADLARQKDPEPIVV